MRKTAQRPQNAQIIRNQAGRDDGRVLLLSPSLRWKKPKAGKKKNIDKQDSPLWDPGKTKKTKKHGQVFQRRQRDGGSGVRRSELEEASNKMLWGQSCHT